MLITLMTVTIQCGLLRLGMVETCHERDIGHSFVLMVSLSVCHILCCHAVSGLAQQSVSVMPGSGGKWMLL